MRAAIEWGVTLLSEDDRILFRRLAVFPSGFTLEAAEEIGGRDADVLDGLGRLLDNSLLRREETADGEPRYAMLETIHEYGLELFASSSDAEPTRGRHAFFYESLASEAESALEGDDQERWLARLEREHDNLRAALRWTLAAGRAEDALRAAASLWRFWYLHGHYAEGRRWLGAALEKSRSAAPGLRVRALVASGALAFLECDYDRAEEMLEESLALARTQDDTRSIALSLQFLGSVSRERGRYSEAVARHDESLALWRALGDDKGVARSLNYVGFSSWLDGDFDAARRLCKESLALFRGRGDREGTAWALLSLASVARYGGDREEATTLAKESLLLSGAVSYKEGSAWALDILGNIARESGQRERAAALLLRSFELHKELGDRWRMSSVLDGLGELASARGEPERAARLHGAADALRRATGSRVPRVERPAREASLASAEAALGKQRVAELLEEGSRTPPERLLS
jgi:predicted ATPase